MLYPLEMMVHIVVGHDYNSQRKYKSENHQIDSIRKVRKVKPGRAATKIFNVYSCGIQSGFLCLLPHSRAFRNKVSPSKKRRQSNGSGNHPDDYNRCPGGVQVNDAYMGQKVLLES